MKIKYNNKCKVNTIYNKCKLNTYNNKCKVNKLNTIINAQYHCLNIK